MMKMQDFEKWKTEKTEAMNRLFSGCGFANDFRQRADGQLRKEIYRLYLYKSGKLPENKDEERSLTIGIVSELADLALVNQHGKPLEEMCNDNGEFLEEYQEQFNRIYDKIEDAVTRFDYGIRHLPN
ncbi:hypothetical protein AAH068_19180 [Bacteroides uniformis]|uniref:hypothetical protein n=1 Tax=Bacteroides uniformis TaxID=820 RepID=UPI0039B58922